MATSSSMDDVAVGVNEISDSKHVEDDNGSSHNVNEVSNSKHEEDDNGSSNNEDDYWLSTVAPLAPVTAQRRLNTQLQQQLQLPYLARALVAVDPEHPHGSDGNGAHSGMSVLQQHCAFFDFDHDGIIYPCDTYRGFRMIGFHALFSLLATIIIHVAFTYYTLPGWIPSLKLPIYLKNIHKAKHGSDTEVYDTEGRFDPAKFDAIFSKYAGTDPEKLSFWELQGMLSANRNSNDFLGWAAEVLEWTALFSIAKTGDGYLEKETLRRMFDGSLWYMLAQHHTTNTRSKNKRR